EKTSIQSIQFKTEANNVLVTMQLLPETTVEKLGFVQHTLQLVLHNPNQTAVVPEKKEVALTPVEQAQDKFQHAVDLINAGDTYAAMNLLGEAMNLSPSDRSIRETYAALLIKNGYVARAKLVLSKGLMTDPSYAPYISMQAHIYASQGLPTRALQLLQSSSPSMKDYPDYYALMAALYQKKGQYMSAAQIYDQLTQLQPDNSMWWVGLGVALESTGKHNAAVEAYQRALTGKPLTPQVQAFVKGRLD
ncbi:MAG: tetratricopeptide repeat protein, partial [Gammaproteobacteria bacterium]|nr:tetratricopeptide repeat protein [Gammaproteobacteria bacterium]